MDLESAFPPTPLQGRYIRVFASKSILAHYGSDYKRKVIKLLYA